MKTTVYNKTNLRDYWAEVDDECEAIEIMARSLAKMAGEDTKKTNPQCKLLIIHNMIPFLTYVQLHDFLQSRTHSMRLRSPLL